MPKFLPVAAAIIGLLCFSAPTLAEDTQTSPSEWHTSWETIQADDIQEYVRLAFSQKHYGIYGNEKGHLYRLQEPILIYFAWPECSGSTNSVLAEYKKNTGLSLTNASGTVLLYKSRIIIFRINSFSDIRNRLQFLRSNMSKAENAELVIKVIEDEFNDNDLLTTQSFTGDDNSASFVLAFLNDKAQAFTNCEQVARWVLHGLITNNNFAMEINKLTDLDYLFTTALYDPSILPNESLDSAKPKIIELMQNKLAERTKP